jgi:flagellar hook-basal body complex protein FliE
MAGLSVDSVLALRSSILQRNAALKDASAANAAGGAASAAGGGAPAPGSDFTSALKNALQDVNELQGKAGDASAAFERGDTTDIASVMLARQQSSVAFEATLQVRNKILSAYKDIMSMPV